MKKINSNHLLFAFGIASVVALIAVCIAFPSEITPLEDLLTTTAGGLIAMSWYILVTILIACVAYAFLRLLDKNIVKQWFRQWTKKLDNKMLLVNAKGIAFYLQAFLYDILNQNKSMLHLPLSSDMSCLLAPGSGFYYRSNSMFYRFSLLVPEKPEMDDRTIRQIVQSYMWTELRQYGISGLSPCFQSKVHGLLPSLYLDRIIYNEVSHTLCFDILYIYTEQSATYAVMAHKRDSAQAAPDAEVFDDDV